MEPFFLRMWDWANAHPYLFTMLAVFWLGTFRDQTFKALTWMRDLWTPAPVSTTTVLPKAAAAASFSPTTTKES